MNLTNKYKSKINLNGKHEKDQSLRKRKIVSSLWTPREND